MYIIKHYLDLAMDLTAVTGYVHRESSLVLGQGDLAVVSWEGHCDLDLQGGRGTGRPLVQGLAVHYTRLHSTLSHPGALYQDGEIVSMLYINTIILCKLEG